MEEFFFVERVPAMFTLFVMITQIGWVETFDELEAQGQFTAAAVYYTTFMIIGVFIFVKIIVAVVVSNLVGDDSAHATPSANANANAKKKRNNLTCLILALIGGGLSESRARTEEEHQGAQVHKRRAGQKQDTPQVTQKHAFRREHCVEKPNTAKVENYFLLLDIIEQNLHEAIELKKRLREIQFELRLMNANFNEDEVVDENEAEEINKLDDEGDALSRWIKSQ
ncbi:hypothetical protein HDU83_005475 [Entophlyctis luteolus]|nr:hypothetical protein HDU83_005475 [Entophlyctis luteolus]